MHIYISKAFDTLNFDILLSKLRYYGLSEILLKLITNYLTNRNQYVKFELYFKSCSNLNWCSTGLHFVFIYIYYLEDFDCRNLDNEINSEIEKINLWLKLNKISLNADKIKYMIFHTNQIMIPPIALSINCKLIAQVSTFNFLVSC